MTAKKKRRQRSTSLTLNTVRTYAKPGLRQREAGKLLTGCGVGVTSIGGELASLACVWTQEIAIYNKPVVGVLNTGNEINPRQIAGDPRHSEVLDTNRSILMAAIFTSAFEVMDSSIVVGQSGTIE